MFQIKKGIEITPIYGIIYGPPGTGKTSFLGGRICRDTGNIINGANSCILIGPENKKEAICSKLDNPISIEQLIQQVIWIRNNARKENIKSVGIDSLDMIEALINTGICKKAHAANIDAVGNYGAGRKQCYAELRAFELLVYNELVMNGLNVWYTAHCTETNISNPMLGTSYDSYKLNLHRSKNMDAAPIFIDKVSTVLFCNTKLFKNDDGYAMGTGERIVYTDNRPGFVAKNRFNLPFEMNLDYTEFINHVKKFYNFGV